MATDSSRTMKGYVIKFMACPMKFKPNDTLLKRLGMLLINFNPKIRHTEKITSVQPKIITHTKLISIETTA